MESDPTDFVVMMIWDKCRPGIFLAPWDSTLSHPVKMYLHGTPLFEEATLKLGEYFNNKEFTIKAEGVSSENIYIQSADIKW